MGLFVFTEVMLFAGLISAFSIARATAIGGMWPPPNQPRLPIATTAFNTAVPARYSGPNRSDFALP